jgi:AcrR family transcriptional regulator
MMRTSGVKPKVDRAAIDLFAAAGVDGVSIADIAAVAGVSQGALYRHYRSKDELARSLFAMAYRRNGEELEAIRAAQGGLSRRVTAMVAHFCALYDRDPTLFRFLLLAQHDFLPHLADEPDHPVAALVRTVADGITAGEVAPIEPALGAAAIIGIVLQTATFHVYGRITGPLSFRTAAIARAAIAAVGALG